MMGSEKNGGGGCSQGHGREKKVSFFDNKNENTTLSEHIQRTWSFLFQN